MGIAGIALATSIVTLATVTYLVIRLKKEIEFKPLELSVFLIKVASAAIIMGLGGYIVSFVLIRFLNMSIFLNQVLHIIITITACIVLFVIGLFLLKVEELNVVTQTLRKALIKKVDKDG